MNRLLQFTISYFGLVPYIYLLADLYLFRSIEPNIILNIMIFNTIIIYTFIGAIHWQWQYKKSTVLYTIHSFIPSLVSFIITIITVLEFTKEYIFIYLAIFLIIQFLLDFRCYKDDKIDYKVIYYLRMPITSLLCIILMTPVLFDYS